ncbi:MAG: UbiA family prenyltransferase, partial [Acidobacteriaceae bacterium]
AVLFWVAGFDVLYACQDAEHDRRAGLKSIPQALGLKKAFGMARAMHGAMLMLLVWLLQLFHLGPIAWWGLVVVMALLFYEHSIVSPKDMRRLNAAFFTLNGIISVLFFGFVAASVTFGR